MSERRDSTPDERDAALKGLRSRKTTVRAVAIAQLCAMFEPLVEILRARLLAVCPNSSGRAN
jgi:hypothetical protein